MTRTATQKIADIARSSVRAIALASLFIGPLAGFAAAQSAENSRSMTGAGFVLYVSLLRG